MEAIHNNIKYLFFWNGIFSNWYPSIFVVDNIEFNCVEQYMMYMKAMTFNDISTAQTILNTNHPKKQKELGRSVKNYDDNVWSNIRYETVKKGLREKFIQNPPIKEYLLKYYGYEFVESSPVDRVWGTGYIDHKCIENIDNWGSNLLGKMLTELSDEFYIETLL
jgi:ribA/ribD-fused uncharacterized protein